MSLVITGASGQLGRLVTAELLKTVDPSQLILLTRTPDALDVPGARGARVRLGRRDARGVRGRRADAADQRQRDRPARRGSQGRGRRRGGRGRRLHRLHVDPEPVGQQPDRGRAPSTARPRSTSARAARRGRCSATTSTPRSRSRRYQAALATGRHVTNGGPVGFVARADCARAAAAVLARRRPRRARVRHHGAGGARGRRSSRRCSPSSAASRSSRCSSSDDEYASGLVKHAGMPEAVAAAYATFGTGARLGYSAVV